eukprot:m.231779 g.231779  ORF g.231779 m.231779 type:complete len:830 (-) comp15226_c0_seq1:2928-5417(-)
MMQEEGSQAQTLCGQWAATGARGAAEVEAMPPSSPGRPAPQYSPASSTSSFLSGLGAKVQTFREQALRSAANVMNSRGVDTHRHGNGNLDLTYITPRIIAMPGFYEKLLTRTGGNLPQDVDKFLSETHGQGNTCIFNVGTKAVEVPLVTKFQQRDINAGSPRALRKLIRVMRAVAAWLQENQQHVAVISAETHGACGTVCASFLCWSRLMVNPMDSVKVFTAKRVVGGASVLSRSQQRYVGYTAKMASGQNPHTRAVRFKEISLLSTPTVTSHGCKPFLVIKIGEKIAMSTRDFPSTRFYSTGEQVVFSDLEVTLLGDITLELWHYSTVLGVDKSKLLCHVKFHTGFVATDVVVFDRDDLDGVDRRKEFGPSFGVKAILEVLPEANPQHFTWLEEALPLPDMTHKRLLFSTSSEYDAFMRDFAVMKGIALSSATSTGTLDEDSRFGSDEDHSEDFAVDAELREAQVHVVSGSQTLDDDEEEEEVIAVQPMSQDTTLLLDFGDTSASAINTATVDDTKLIDVSLGTAKPVTEDSLQEPTDDLVDLLGGMGMDQSRPAHVNLANSTGSDLLDFTDSSKSKQPASAAPPSDDPFAGLFGAPVTPQSQTMHHSTSSPDLQAMSTKATPSTNVFAFDDLAASLHSGTRPSGFPAKQSRQTPQPQQAQAQVQPQLQTPAQPPPRVEPQQTPSSSSFNAAAFSKPQAQAADPMMFNDLLAPRFQQKDKQQQTLAELHREQRAKYEDPIKLKVETWAEGKEGNLRALLASLQDVLWEGARWTPLNVGQLMNPAVVKKTYQRACLLVHPDRHSSSDEHKELANEVFVKLSFAYKEFDP